MSLADELRDILVGVLPSKPEEAVFGTALLELVRPKLSRTFSDNSIRQTFSVLAADPTSPIAKVDQGSGYYRRPAQQPPIPTGGPAAGTNAPGASTGTPRDHQLEEKFRALFFRNSQYENRFPVHIEHTAAAHQPAGVNKWKFPDLVEVAWDVGEAEAEVLVLNKALLEVKRSLGEQPFRLTSVELKVELALGNFRENFFQCVSNSMWSHSAQLVVAAPISDALLATELRRLGTSYGVQVQSFNLNIAQLGAFPSAAAILKVPDDDFEEMRRHFNPTAISPGVPRPALDWDHIRDMMKQSREFSDVFDWIARCLRDSRAYTFEKFAQLREIETLPG